MVEKGKLRDDNLFSQTPILYKQLKQIFNYKVNNIETRFLC